MDRPVGLWSLLFVRETMAALVFIFGRSFRLVAAMLAVLGVGCGQADGPVGAGNSAVDRTVVASSKYPLAVKIDEVGKYPALSKSGGGYFYDDVLEYRVWIEGGAGGDTYRAFACYEVAAEFSKTTPRAEEPLVLVRQIEWINEPKPGVFEVKNEERITEWRVEWLPENKRTAGSITNFLASKASDSKRAKQ
jgi:putative acetyltransferase